MGIFEGAMLTTFTSLVVEHPAGTKPVQPASQDADGRLSEALMRHPCLDVRIRVAAEGAQRSLSPVLRMRAHSIVVLEWLSILNAVPMPAVLMVVLSIGAFRFSLLR